MVNGLRAWRGWRDWHERLRPHAIDAPAQGAGALAMPSVTGWLSSKILWFGVLLSVIFALEGALMYSIDRHDSEHRVDRALAAIAPEVTAALVGADAASVQTLLDRHVDGYALLAATVVSEADGRTVRSSPRKPRSDGIGGALRLALPDALAKVGHSTNLVHEGRRVGSLDIVLDNSSFAGAIVVMMASAIAALFALLWLASGMVRRVRQALRAPADAIEQMSSAVSMAGNLDYRIGSSGRPETFGFEGKVNQFLETVSGRERAQQAASQGLRDELAARSRDIAVQARQLQTLAYTSVDTQLPNRTAMMERLRALCAEAAGGTRVVGLFMCHVSKYKHATEAFGFDVAAALVRFAAARLGETSPRFGELFHLGGADFAVLVEGEAEQMQRIVDKLLFAEEEPFLQGGATLHLKLRIGYALYPDDAASADELSRFAPLALSEAISPRVPGAAVRFQPELLLNAMAKESLEDAIRNAVDHDMLEPFFQPRVDAVSGRVRGFEAFVRWRSPALQGQDNQNIIKIAERSMLITALDDRMLRRVAAWAGSLAREGIRVPIAVNVSARTLQQDDYVQRLRATLQEFHVDPSQIELELTETVLIEGSAAVAAALSRLEALGVRILLDDFGSGYSSLRYLYELPISTVKIDKAFVQGLPHDETSRLIIGSTLELCRRMGKQTVAEGVESQEQLEHLRAIGCDEVQGYYLMRPKSAAQTRQILVEQYDTTAGYMAIAAAVQREVHAA